MEVIHFIFDTVPERQLLSLMTLNRKIRKHLLTIGAEEKDVMTLTEGYHFIQLTKKKKDPEFWKNFNVGACEIQDQELFKFAAVHSSDTIYPNYAAKIGKENAVRFMFEKFNSISTSQAMFDVACKKGRLGMVEKFATPNWALRGIDYNHGYHLAKENGQEEIMKLLSKYI